MNKFMEMIINNKRKIILIILVLLILLIVISISIFIGKKIEEKENNIDISNSIHGIVINENIGFYKKPKESRWKYIRDFKFGENVYIVDEFNDDGKEWYKIKASDRVGYVKKENVDYYEFSDKDGKVLMSDVSKFNIQFKHFKGVEDYEAFILKCNINYVYIRAGGRGYGEEGKFYTDTQYKIFIEACEYLGVPYGFYYIDEAINSEEILAEVEFIDKFLKENATDLCVLPLAIDIENHDGVGRADEIWEERADLVSELIGKFKEKNIDTLIYSNANIANKYLYNIDSKFWLAYYNLEKKVPNYWLSDTDQEVALNTELMEKVIAWQFTETGAGDEITYPVDVSLVDNKYFRNFVRK